MKLNDYGSIVEILFLDNKDDLLSDEKDKLL